MPIKMRRQEKKELKPDWGAKTEDGLWKVKTKPKKTITGPEEMEAAMDVFKESLNKMDNTDPEAAEATLEWREVCSERWM